VREACPDLDGCVEIFHHMRGLKFCRNAELTDNHDTLKPEVQ
jgi:hypothetical protein